LFVVINFHFTIVVPVNVLFTTTPHHHSSPPLLTTTPHHHSSPPLLWLQRLVATA
jgi:hypothetical protein